MGNLVCSGVYSTAAEVAACASIKDGIILGAQDQLRLAPLQTCIH